MARKGELEDATELGLGVERANEGIVGLRGSGVRGGDVTFCVRACTACTRDAELIHFSSRDPKRGGDDGSGRTLKASAKCSLMNLKLCE